jgi:hypothetical protein
MTTLRVLVIAILAFCAGCGKIGDAKNRAVLTNDLKEIGLAYINFQESEQRPPQSFDELNKKSPLSPGCAKVNMIWGAGMAGLCKDGASNEIVIGHVASPGTTNMIVLFCDGTVQQLTADEYSRAKKATPRKK